MHQYLELHAVAWLRYERQCSLVCLGRDVGAGREGTALYGCQPDVLGVTKTRRTVEIEIKRSVADLRAQKRKMRLGLNPGPNQYFYLVPREIAEKCKRLLQDGEGLLSWCSVMRMDIVVPAPLRHKQRLSFRQCIGMARSQAATLWSLMSEIEELRQWHPNYKPEFKPDSVAGP